MKNIFFNKIIRYAKYFVLIVSTYTPQATNFKFLHVNVINGSRNTRPWVYGSKILEGIQEKEGRKDISLHILLLFY